MMPLLFGHWQFWALLVGGWLLVLVVLSIISSLIFWLIARMGGEREEGEMTTHGQIDLPDTRHLPLLTIRGQGWTITGRMSEEDAEQFAAPRRAEGQTVTIDRLTDDVAC